MLFLAFVLTMGAVMYATKEGTVTNQGTGLKMVAGRLAVYYQETPPPAGWAIAAIQPRAGEVWVDLILPEDKAAGIYHDRRRPLLDALRTQCPPKTDAAWSVLLNTQDIEIRGLSPTGKALAAVSCRAVR